MNICTESSTTAYSRLQDDYSRWIYEKRAMYCLTGDSTYMTELGESVLDMNILNDLMRRLNEVKDRLVVRGAGNDYHVIKRMYPDFDFALFSDNDPSKIGGTIDGKEVISPDEFYENYSEYYVLVNSAAANHEIVAELKAHGIPSEKIFNLADSYEEMCDKQYFDKKIILPEPGEVFVDGGSYDGRTIRQFISWCDGNYNKIYAFEPDSANCRWLKDNVGEISNSKIEIFNRGLWDSSCELSFSNNGNQGSKITESGENIIKTISIDEAVNGDKVTFLKLDVEGAEYKALLGASETIKKHHPKLTISIYHKPEDIFELPELILSMWPEYHFYLRHYQLGPYETIFYCLS